MVELAQGAEPKQAVLERGIAEHHGVFAPNAKWRSRVVPTVRPPPTGGDTAPGAERQQIAAWMPPRPRRLDWAALPLRVFKIHVLKYDQCGGRMRVLAFLTDPDVTSATSLNWGCGPTHHWSSLLAHRRGCA